jgi:hypothetical protein
MSNARPVSRHAKNFSRHAKNFQRGRKCTSIDVSKNAAYVEASIDADFDDIDGAEKELREQYGRLKDADD